MIETFQLSSDALYYLKDNEQPLIEDSLDEAYAIEAMFPKGFTIISFTPIGTSGYFNVVIGPRVPDNILAIPKYETLIQEDEKEVNNYYSANAFMYLAKGERLEVHWIDTQKDNIEVYWHDLVTGKRDLYGTFKVRYTNAGLRYFQKDYPNNTFSRFYLKHFTAI